MRTERTNSIALAAFNEYWKGFDTKGRPQRLLNREERDRWRRVVRAVFKRERELDERDERRKAKKEHNSALIEFYQKHGAKLAK